MSQAENRAENTNGVISLSVADTATKGKVEYTKGPWKAIDGTYYEEERWGVYVDGPMQYHIATIENGAPGDTLDTEAANARLIAAAPELLEAVRSAMNRLRNQSGIGSVTAECNEITYQQCASALAKAEGVQP